MRTAEKKAELLSRLGKEPDISLAKEFQLSRERIRQLREQHGIAKPARIHKTKEFYTPKAIWIKRYGHLFGTMYDLDIAKKAGVGRGDVVQARRRCGIAAFGKQSCWRKQYEHLLGKTTDASIAKEAGVTIAAVGKVRNKLNIPRFVPEHYETHTA